MKQRAGSKPTDHLTERAARANVRAFDRIMARSSGQAPQPEDEIPDAYRRKKQGPKRPGR
jgi:hypothetical protein